MSQSVLIVKGEEWTRRNSLANTTTTTTTTSSSNNNNNSPWNSVSSNSTTGSEFHSPTASSSLESPAALGTTVLERRRLVCNIPGNHGTTDMLSDESRFMQQERRTRMNDFTPVRTNEEDSNNNNNNSISISINNSMMEAASFPSDSEDTDRASPTSLPSSIGSESPWIISHPSVYETTSCHNQDDIDNDRRIRDLELALQIAFKENTRLEQVADAAQSQRAKTLGNLKKKRAELDQALSHNQQLKKELDQANQMQINLQEENESLKLGLQKVAATKEMIKAKLKTRDETFKESQKEITGLRQQLNQMEHVHTLERELLEHYRKLARHTGFYRWGKPIRLLENQLAEPSTNLTASSSF